MKQAVNESNSRLWLETLSKDPIPVMLKAAPLPIRYQVLRDILDDRESADFQALQKNLRKHQSRRKILAAQAPRGLWPLDGKLTGLDKRQVNTLQFVKQIETLHELLNLLVTSKQKKINLGMRNVLRSLADDELPLRIHHVTQAVYLAISFNLADNPIIKQLIWKMLKQQNADGGWSSLPGESNSCLWSSLFILWTLGHVQQFRTNRTLKKGLHFVEANLLSPDHSQLLPGLQPWDTLTSGTQGLSILTGGTLRYLETVQLLADKERSRKSEKMVDWLINIQLKTGLWPSIVNRDKQGDYAVTLRVLKVIKYFQSRRIAETMHYESVDPGTR